MNLFRAGRLSYSDNELAKGTTPPWLPIGSAVITICVFSIGLIFWFTVVFGFVPLNLAEAREFWLGRVTGWPTLFEAFVITTVLLGWWVFFRVVSTGLQPNPFTAPLIALYIANLTVICVIGYTLYIMRTTVLNDQLYVWMQKSESTKMGRYYLGRIREKSPETCGGAPEPCVLVELENGEVVIANDPGGLNEPETEIVVVDSVLGSRSGVLRYYQLDYYIQGDTELNWRNITRGRK